MKNIFKISLIVLIFSSIIGLTSCKKCVKCHQIKVYNGATTGSFQIISIQEACGELECRKYRREKSQGTDAGGDYKTFWECNLYPEDTTALF